MKKTKLLFLYILSFVLTLAPILIYFFVNMDKYVSTTYEGIKLFAGGVILACVLLLKVLGKLKTPSGVCLFGVLFVLSYLLNAILQDLMIFSMLALIGEVADSVVCIFINREKRRQREKSCAELTAKEVERVLSGRV